MRPDIKNTDLKYSNTVNLEAKNSAHAKFISMVGKNKHVLELGCHAGDVSEALAGRGCTVWGIEIDEKAARLAENKCSGVTVADLDRTELDQLFSEQHFDVIAMGDVIEHLADPLKVLKSARELLTPGGIVVISVPNVAHVSVRLSLLGGEFIYGRIGILDNTHRRFFTASSLKRLLYEAGFEITVWDQVDKPWTQDKMAERLSALGIPASMEIKKVLSSPQASTYQYVVSASPRKDCDEKTRVVIISPEGENPLHQLLEQWDQSLPRECGISVVVPSSALEEYSSLGKIHSQRVKLFSFSRPGSIGSALNLALEDADVYSFCLITDNIAADPSLVHGFLDEAMGVNPAEVVGLYASLDLGTNMQNSWWQEAAASPLTGKRPSLEYCQAFNLCLFNSWIEELTFDETLPYPWILIDWVLRVEERKLELVKAAGVVAHVDFEPTVPGMETHYARYGRALGRISESHPHLTNLYLGKRIGIAKRLRQIPRRRLLTAGPEKRQDKFFDRLRTIALQDGYREQKRAAQGRENR